MNTVEIEERRRELIQRYGEWTAHNIRLGPGLFTMGETPTPDDVKLRRVVQVLGDLAGAAIDSLRFLDLACLEGMYSVDLAARGARVVAIEGRQANLEKAQLAKDALGLETLELLKGDVRDLDVRVHGEFDVVLCLGILYHLDAPDVFSFMRRVADACRRFAIIDTHIALAPERLELCDGQEYWGRTYVEHSARADASEKEKALWASLDNTQSFWMTRRSLVNLLGHVGFSSVHECLWPAEPEQPADRVTLVALKGKRQSIVASPLADARPPDRWPEEAREGWTARARAGLVSAARWAIPTDVRRRVGAAVGRGKKH